MLELPSVVDEKGNMLSLGHGCDPKMLLRLAGRALSRRLAINSSLAGQLTSINVADGNHRASFQVGGHAPMGTLGGLERLAINAWWDNFRHEDGKLIP